MNVNRESNNLYILASEASNSVYSLGLNETANPWFGVRVEYEMMRGLSRDKAQEVAEKAFKVGKYA